MTSSSEALTASSWPRSFERRWPVAFSILIATWLSIPRAAANIGVGSVNPVVGLDVATTGSASAIIVPRDTTVNRPAPAVNGMLRYNTTANAMEMFVNGGWAQVAAQPLGSTSNLVNTGPSSTAVYAVSNANVTCNYTPGFGACVNINSGIWPANGSGTASNATCVQLQGNSSQAIVYDLGTDKTINNVYLTIEDYIGVDLGQISFSTDNVTFTSSTTVNSVTYYNNGSRYVSVALSPNVSARYVRLMNGGTTTNSTNGVVCNLAVGP